jgi:hypothetical protein
MLTALSLLYLYHILGLKKRRLDKAEGQYSIAGLINSTGGGHDEEIKDEIKEQSKKLT